MLRFRRVKPAVEKALTIYHTLLYVVLVLSLFINYAEYSGFLGIQSYGEQTRAKQQIAQEKAEAKEVNERMMAAIEKPPEPVKLKKAK